ncbi:hypothetical protein GCM10010401_13210 [Rarobacter faecitabidus]|uniref:Bacterial Ig-like domain-containing protein n=1 Tax=Rarobacter faecitabidus TaxID=13243 RepID=A0A542ZED4_RARFA|nr:hypothetical protein [Rarobacter faecitabidus]TQL58630.1 hypothetical protein FB461_2048 [Rarobacter faecitabidus]
MNISHRVRAGAVTVGAILALAATMVATPAQATPGTGQTRSISGVLKNFDGTPASGATLNYDNVLCDGSDDIDGAADDSSTVVTSATGTFSFLAYATQCYSVGTSTGLWINGTLSEGVVAPAGTSNLNLKLASPIDLNLTLTGVGAGANVALLHVLVYNGLTLWAPVDSGTTDAAGKVTLSGYKGSRYAVRIGRTGDIFTQYIGSPSSDPKLSGGPGTYTSPSTGASFNQTLTPSKSSPVNLSLTGVDAGANVSVINWNSFPISGGTISETTATAGSITLRGVNPGRNYITVRGSLGAAHVYGEAVNVNVTTNPAAPVNVSINATPSDASLSSGSNAITTVSGSTRIGSQLKAATTLTGPAAQFAGLPSTSVQHYWLSGQYGLTGGSLRLRGEGPTLTVPADLADDQLLVVMTIIKIPGYDSLSTLGIAWISPQLAPLLGSTVLPATDIAPGNTPFPTTIPAVTGTAVAGKTLTAAPGTWSESPAGFTYRWSRNGKPIAGATARAYKLSAADVGARIAVTVTPVKPGHKILGITSAPTGKVAKAAASVSAKVAKKSVKKGKKATITVKVTAAGLKPSGKVTVKFGKKKVTKKLGKKGTVKITSPKLKKGKVKVTVSYAGDKATKAAKLAAKKAKKLTITVK